MIFLIEYNRSAGVLVNMAKYKDSERDRAMDARFKRELELHREGVKHDVVILEAKTEAQIRRTHRRYFETLEELLSTDISKLK